MRKKRHKPSIIDVAKLLGGLVSPGTIATYAHRWQQYIDFALTFENAIKATTLIDWRQYMVADTDYSANYINLSINSIKSIIRELYAQRKVSREAYWDVQEVKILPPNALLNRRRQNNRVKISPEEMRELCKVPPISEDNYIALRDRALMMLLATSGCRISEALAIKYRDIKKLPDNKYMITNIMGKNQSEPRNAPLSAEAFSAVEDWIAFRPISSPYVFTNIICVDNGEMLYVSTPMNKSSATRRLKAYGESIGLVNIKAHDFRRFVGTQLARQDIRIAQKVLGHKKIETTARHYVLDEIEAGVTENLF